MSIIIDAGNVSLAGNKITNLAPGTASTDAVNKAQLDAVASSSSGSGGETGGGAGSGPYHLVPLLAEGYEFLTNSDGQPLVTRFFEE